MVWISLNCEFDDNQKQWLRYHSNMPRSQLQAAQETSFLDYKSALNIESSPINIRATNITCCIGHKSNHDVKSLQDMMENGMNIARLDTTISLDNYSKIIKNIKEAANNYSERLGQYFPIGIAVDTVGSTVRTGFIQGGKNKEIELITGTNVKLTSDPAYMYKCSIHVIYVDFEDICALITHKQNIYIDEGSIKLVCQSIAGVFITCKVDEGGILGSQKGVIIPDININLPNISECDKVILEFASKEKVDFIFCAYIANATSVLEIRKILGEKGKNIKVISKIQNQKGLKNLSEIIKVSDGILIGRGDLGTEVTLPKLFIAQKYIIAMCNKVGCPVIISRQLMESMLYTTLPTRAEVNDAANAIEDGADMFTLPKKMIMGGQANTVLKLISQICKEAEAAVWRLPYDKWILRNDKDKDKETDLGNALAQTVVSSSLLVGATVILAITENGETVYNLSKYRPRCPILAITRNIRVVKQCNLYRSIIPFLCTDPVKSNQYEDVDGQIESALSFIKKRNIVHSNDPIIVIIGNIKHHICKNTMRILYVEEELEMCNNVLKIK